MCGRFTLTVDDVASLARRWAAEVDAELAARWRPRFNVAPGDRHPVLVASGGGRRVISAVFGVASPGAERPTAPLFNARLESAASRPTFREAWRTARAAVPADGFYEWQGPASARRPTWFHLPGRSPMLLAALLGEAPGGGPGFTVLTRPALAPVRALHDRMPVLLPPALLAAWLSGDAPTLPDPTAGELLALPVSPRVNAVENDDPACLEPDRQGSLF